MSAVAVDYAHIPNGTTGYSGSSTVQNVINFLIANGYTVPASGAGADNFGASLGYSATGWVGDLHGSQAWARVRAPDGSFEVLFQRIANYPPSNSSAWLIVYSVLGFTGGFPGYNTIPTATDGQVINGGGGGSLSGNQFFPTTDNTHKTTTIVLTSAPHGFALLTYGATSASPCTALIVDPLQAGTYDATENDPHVIFCGFTTAPGGLPIQNPDYLSSNVTNPAGSTANAASAGLRCWYKNGLAGAAFQGVGVMAPTDGGYVNMWPRQLDADALTGKDPLIWVNYGRVSTRSSPHSWKGKSSLLKYLLTNRAQQDLMTLSVARDHFVVGDLVILWDGTATAGTTYAAEQFEVAPVTAALTALYKMNGLYSVTGLQEEWVVSDPSLASPTGHTLTDVTIAAVETA